MVSRTTRWALLGALSTLALAGCAGGWHGDGGPGDGSTADGGQDVMGDVGADGMRLDAVDAPAMESGNTDGGRGETGAEAGGTDGGSTDVDSGSTDVDAGRTDMDSGNTDVDSGSTDVDSGSTDVDAGMPVMMGDTCADAAAIGPGTVMGDLATLAADYDVTSDANNCQSASGADALYVIKVPAGQRLTATVTPSSGLDPVLNLTAHGNCGASPLMCLAGADVGYSGQPETVRYLNTGTADAFVTILVASYRLSPSSTTFTLTTALDTPSTAGESCATAQSITPGTLSNETLSGGTADMPLTSDTGACQSATGNDRVYAINVPAGQQLSATANSTSNLVVNLIAAPDSNCTTTPRPCLAGSDSGNPETARYTNATGADQTVFIEVAASSTTGDDANYSLTTTVQPPPAGDTCASAQTITPGTLSGETLAGANVDYSLSSDSGGCQSATGNDRAYAIVIPAGQLLTATVNSTVDLVANLIAGPDTNCGASPRACLSGSDSVVSGNETVSYLNNTAADMTAYIVVAAYSSTTSTATYTLTTSLITPTAAGENCGAAIALTPGTLTGESLAGASADYALSADANNCQSSSGADRVYTLAVPPGKRFTATADSASNLVLNLVAGPDTNCAVTGSRTCLAGSDSGNPESVSYTNNGSADQQVYLIVSASTSTGNTATYNLTTAVITPPAGDTCASAPTITPGTLSGESLAGTAPDHAVSTDGNGCQRATGNDRAYAIVVPAGQRLTAAADSPADLVVNLVAGPDTNCTAVPLTCLTGSDSGNPETVTYTNTGSASTTVYIVVSAYSSTGNSATYTLTTSLATPPPPTPGATCETATTIVPGTLSGESLANTGADYPVSTDGNNCQATSGNDKAYAIVVPAGQRLTASANSTSDLVVNLLAGPFTNCTASPLVCVAGSDSGNPETVTYMNSTAADQTMYLIVSAYGSSGNSATFSLTTTLVTPPPPPPGDTCTTASSLGLGTLMGESLAGANVDYSLSSDTGACQAATGNDRAYTITVPAGKRFTATVNSTTDLVVNLIAGPDPASCGASPRVCLAGSDSVVSGNETVSYLNNTAVDQTLYVVVSAYSGSTSTATYNLTTSVITPPADETCGGATAILSPGTYSGQDLVGYTRDYSISTANGCQSYSGAERVYAMTVPAGKRLSAIVTPGGTTTSGLNPVIEIIHAPASNCSAASVTCVASANASTSGGVAETATYTNYTTSDETVFIVVASSAASPTDTTFTLDALIDAPSVGESCGTAQIIAATGTLAMESLSGFNHDYATSTSPCKSASGADRVYSIAVPAGQRLTVSGTGAAGLDLVLNLVPGAATACGASPLRCSTGADATAGGGTETVSFTNSSSADQNVFILVSSYGTSPTATTYSLTSSLTPVNAGEICGTATVIAAPGTLANQDLAGFGRDYAISTVNGCQTYSGVERVYAITVPAGKQLNTTVVGGTGFNPVVEIFAGASGAVCDALPTTCNTSANATGTAGTETTHWVNGSSTDVTAYIVVGSSSSTPSGTTFTLTTDVSTPPVGDACGIAQPIMPGTLAAESITGFYRDYAISTANGCRTYSGVDRAYAVTVPAGKQLTATAVGGTGFDPVLNIVAATGAACDASPVVCVASANATTTAGTESTVWVNASATDQTVYVLVSSSSATPTGTTYSLTTSVDYPVPGDTCVDPTMITTSGTLSGETLAGFIRHYGPTSDANGCQGGSGVDRAYAVVVPNGSTLSVTENSSFDTVLNLIAGPATNCTTSPTCLAGSDSVVSGNETVSYTNTTGADRTVFIVVSAYSATLATTPTYSLTTSLSP